MKKPAVESKEYARFVNLYWENGGLRLDGTFKTQSLADLNAGSNRVAVIRLTVKAEAV